MVRDGGVGLTRLRPFKQIAAGRARGSGKHKKPRVRRAAGGVMGQIALPVHP